MLRHPKLRHFQPLSAVEGRLMCHNARDGHVERLGYIHQWLPILENCGHKLVHQVTMRSAVAAGSNFGWQAGPYKVGKLRFQPFVLPVERTFLAADAPDFTAR